MLPRWHVLFGVVFSLLLFYLFDLSYLEAFLVFFASVFIDFDHYMIFVWHQKKIRLKEAFKFYDELIEWERKMMSQGRKIKSHLQIFHTLEFNLLILALCFVFPIMFFILIGMIFHSLIDIIWMMKENKLHLRYFFFVFWIIAKYEKRYKK